MKMINNTISYAFIALLMIAGNAQLMAKNGSQSIETDNISTNTTVTRQNWNFTAYLDEKKIGYHNFEVINNDGEIIVNTQAKFDVSFMFIPIYSYEHVNKEIWRKNCLISLESRTSDDGEELFVRLSNENGNTIIDTHEKNGSKADCVRSFAYWDYDLIKSKTLLNSQTGELINVSYNFVGSEIIDVNNESMNAMHYQLKGKDNAGKSIDISLWYNSNKQWLALQSRLDNGYSLRYQLEQDSVQ